jgi:hypothetical protein
VCLRPAETSNTRSAWRPGSGAGRRSPAAGVSSAAKRAKNGPSQPKSAELRCTGSPRINDQEVGNGSGWGKETSTWKGGQAPPSSYVSLGGAGLDRRQAAQGELVAMGQDGVPEERRLYRDAQLRATLEESQFAVVVLAGTSARLRASGTENRPMDRPGLG